MSSILKGIKLNEVNPHNYDSDVDYYNALNRKPRGRTEDDYVEPELDEPIQFQPKTNTNTRPVYSISKDENKDAGYNMTVTVKAATTEKAQQDLEGYIDHNWGAKKQVGKITPVSDGVVQVHMIDNHKYGMWKPWKDEDPIAKPLSFKESKERNVSVLTEARTYKLWENAGQKIAEAQLTADQINQIFQYAEKIQTAGGDNRTMLGKGKDAASAVNKAWEDLKTKVQDSGPIKNVDAMYDKAAEQLKQATGGDQGVMKYVQKYRDFAKKHPIAQSLIYSALIAAAGISGAGLGGAAALGLFKMVDKLLQGEKFSSATYQGAKTGAMAYGASKLADYIKGGPKDAPAGGATDAAGQAALEKGIAADQAFQDSLLNKYPTDMGYTYKAAGKSLQVFDETGRKVFTGDIPLKSMDMKTFADLTNAGKMATSGVTYGSAASDAMAGVTDAASNTATSTVSNAAGTMSGITSDQMVNHPAYQAMIQKFGDNPGSRQAAMSAAKAAILRGEGLDTATNVASNAATNVASNAVTSAGSDIVSKAADVASNLASEAPKGAGMAADYLQKVISGEHPRPMISPEQAQAALDWQAQNGGQLASTAANAAGGAAKGFSKDYLQKVISGELPRPLISPEKAKELLGQMNESKQLSESQIYLIIGKIVEKQKLKEGVMDTIKGAAGKAVDWAKTKGTNLTTKVTADKLLQAWKKAGSPMDSLDVASIIQKAGVPADTIKQVYSNMKIPFAGQPGAGADTGRKIDVDPSSVAPGAPTSAPSASTPSATASAPSATELPAGGKGTGKNFDPQTGKPISQYGQQQAAATGTGSTAAGGTTSTGTGTTASGTSTASGTGATPNSATYEQVKKLIDELDDAGKKTVTTALKKELELAESKDEYGPDYQAMVKRVGQMAKQGERKTVWDPVKRVYKTVPTKQQVKEYK